MTTPGPNVKQLTAWAIDAGERAARSGLAAGLSTFVALVASQPVTQWAWGTDLSIAAGAGLCELMVSVTARLKGDPANASFLTPKT